MESTNAATPSDAAPVFECVCVGLCRFRLFAQCRRMDCVCVSDNTPPCVWVCLVFKGYKVERGLLFDKLIKCIGFGFFWIWIVCIPP